jgi:hypothetical protein
MMMTTVADGLYQYGGMPVGPGSIMGLQAGNWFFVDPVNGADGNSGRSPARAFATLYAAHAAMVSGNNDVCVLIGNGAASGSARLSKALAQSIDPAVTAGTLVWSKNACHLIGTGAPTRVAQRARIAPPSGTYTQSTFGSANFITVSGSGCIFANISVFNGFSTGGTNQIAWTDTGNRNFYWNMNIMGMGDATSAQNAGSRSLKIGAAGSGEHTFVDCVIGGDTVTRTTANASLELAGGTPRNTFLRCTFPFQTSNAGVLGILGTGAACIDRWNMFDQCSFVNNIKSTSTQMTVLASLTSASPGGLLQFKACALIGMTKVGDTNALANSYIDMPAVSASAGGLSLNPS